MNIKQYMTNRFVPANIMKNFGETINTNFGREAIVVLGTVSTGSPTLGTALGETLKAILSKKEKNIAQSSKETDSFDKKANMINNMFAEIKKYKKQGITSLNKKDLFQIDEKGKKAQSMKPKI